MSIITRKEAVEIRMKNYLDDEMLDEMVNVKIEKSLEDAFNIVQVAIPYYQTNMLIIKKLLKRIKKSGYAPEVFLGEHNAPEKKYRVIQNAITVRDEKNCYYVVEFFID